MRPKEAKRRINLAFKKAEYFDTKNNNGLIHLKKVKDCIEKLLKRELRLERTMWGDNETSMYYEYDLDNIDLILEHLFYISDRWHCVGRLKFLLAVINKY